MKAIVKLKVGAEKGKEMSSSFSTYTCTLQGEKGEESTYHMQTRM